MDNINEFIILDLFCGAGGFSYGMHENEHFKTVIAVDFDYKATDTFKQNMPSTEVITGDITSQDIKEEIITKSKKAKVNMIIGGPPCQGFSMKGKKLGLDDERNYLFLEYLKIVKIIEPEVFVIENVKSLLSTAGGWFRDELISYVKKLGYSVNYGILKAKEFGVPQARERAIFICSKNKNITLPVKNTNIVTVKEAISDLAYLESGEGDYESQYITEATSEYQKLMRRNSEKLYNHKATNHLPIALEKLAMIPAEKGKEYLPESIRGKQKFKGTWGRLKWNEVSPTIDTRFDTPSNGTNSHPELNRSITPREAARIQSFNDKFIFYGSKFYIRRQIGNAVPPLLAKAIADKIWETYEENKYTNNVEKFSKLSMKYENELDNDFKKRNGIFYTDLSLVQSIVEFLKIPNDVNIIDPCCGIGSFLYVLKQSGYRKIFGCDFDEKTVDKCKDLTKIETIYTIDTIGKSGTEVLKKLDKEPFDYIIGNPPYAPLGNGTVINASKDFIGKVRASGSNLFIASIYRTFELVKEDGYVSIIVPKNLLHISSYKEMRKDLLKNKRLVSVIELGIHFKTVRGEQIVLTFQNFLEKDNKIKFYTHNRGTITLMSEIPQDYYKDEIIAFTSNQEVPIYDKLKDIYPKLKDVCIEGIRRGREKSLDAIRGKQIRKFGLRDTYLPSKGNQIFIQNIFSAEAGITASFAGDISCGETVTIVTLKNEIMCKYILGLLHSRVCNYYLIRFKFNNSRLTMHTDAKYLNDIPIVRNKRYFNKIVDKVCEMEKAEYMKSEWFSLNEELNCLVYDAFEISFEDRKYIEAEMRKISAGKWYGTSL